MIRPLLAASLCAAVAGCATSASSHAAPAPFAAQAVAAAAPQVEAQPAEAAPPSRRERVRRILGSNVRLFVWDQGEAKKSASGVVVGSELTSTGSTTYILTNAHALDSRGMKAPELRVTVDRPWEEGGVEPLEYLAAPVAVGSLPDMDLALVKILGVRLEAAELAGPEELVPGDEVLVAAAPFGRAISVSGGIVSHVQWNREGEPTLLKTDAPIGYGASGGGVYSLETGRLLALVEGYRTAKVGFAVQNEKFSFDVPMPGETFAAPAPKVRAFLTAKGYARLLDRASGEDTARTAAR